MLLRRFVWRMLALSAVGFKDHRKVRVEETLNAMLDAKADELGGGNHRLADGLGNL